jgi:hypothetical protein
MTGHGGCHILLLGVMATASPTMPDHCVILDTSFNNTENV